MRPSARGFRSSPASGDPFETALAEAEKVAKLAADREVEPGPGQLADGWRPAGEPLVARDVYGSRRLVMAPFSCDGRAPDHWYAWDIDLCWIAVVAAPACSPRPGTRCVNGAMPSAPQPPGRRCPRARRG